MLSGSGVRLKSFFCFHPPSSPLPSSLLPQFLTFCHSVQFSFLLPFLPAFNPFPSLPPSFPISFLLPSFLVCLPAFLPLLIIFLPLTLPSFLLFLSFISSTLYPYPLRLLSKTTISNVYKINVAAML